MLLVILSAGASDRHERQFQQHVIRLRAMGGTNPNPAASSVRVSGRRATVMQRREAVR